MSLRADEVHKPVGKPSAERSTSKEEGADKDRKTVLKTATCRRHVKTRADQTEKHIFSRSRYTAFSRSRAAERQGGFHGRPQQSDRRIHKRGSLPHARKRQQSSAHAKGSNV